MIIIRSKEAPGKALPPFDQQSTRSYRHEKDEAVHHKQARKYEMLGRKIAWLILEEIQHLLFVKALERIRGVIERTNCHLV